MKTISLDLSIGLILVYFLVLFDQFLLLNDIQVSSLQYWDQSCSYQVSTIHGLHTMLTRDTKGSHSLTYLLYSFLQYHPYV